MAQQPFHREGNIAFLQHEVPGVLVLRCEVCGDMQALAGRWQAEAEGVEFVAAHKHEPPQPLTPEEREQVRVRGIHRRGALREGT